MIKNIFNSFINIIIIILNRILRKKYNNFLYNIMMFFVMYIQHNNIKKGLGN